MHKRITAWLRKKREQAREAYLDRLKATYKRHYREYLDSDEVARTLGRMASLRRSYATDAARELGEDHQTVMDARREALMYSTQSQQEYEAADFHYAAYIEARETYRKAIK